MAASQVPWSPSAFTLEDTLEFYLRITSYAINDENE